MGGFVADGAVPENIPRAEAIAMIRATPDDLGAIDRLCRAAVRGLSVSGAVTALAAHDARLAGASDERAQRIGELEFSAGDGPATTALRTRRPLLTPDLSAPTAPAWPAYTPPVGELGVVGVYAFPLHVGAVQLGVLVLTSDDPAPLEGPRLALAFAFAEIATETLLDSSSGSDGATPGLDMASVLDAHAEVYQAQGTIMVQLGVGLADALARLRARAFVQGRDLAELARDVLEGRERFGDSE